MLFFAASTAKEDLGGPKTSGRLFNLVVKGLGRKYKSTQLPHLLTDMTIFWCITPISLQQSIIKFTYEWVIFYFKRHLIYYHSAKRFWAPLWSLSSSWQKRWSSSPNSPSLLLLNWLTHSLRHTFSCLYSIAHILGRTQSTRCTVNNLLHL